MGKPLVWTPLPGSADPVGGMSRGLARLGLTCAPVTGECVPAIPPRIHAFGQGHVRPGVPIVDSDFSGEQNGGSLRRERLDVASMSLLPSTPGITRSVSTRSTPPLLNTSEASSPLLQAISEAAGLEHDLADRKGLFVIVNTKDGSFRLHSALFLLPRWQPDRDEGARSLKLFG